MKTCPVCGLDLDESYLFCPEDGSALVIPEASASEDEAKQVRKEEKSNSVVLYCPACAAEYPLTFSLCPVHAVPLTKHKILVFAQPPLKANTNESRPVAQRPIVEEAAPVIEAESPALTEIEAPQPSAAQVEDAQLSTARGRRRFRFRPKTKASSYTLIKLAEPALSSKTDAEQIDDPTDDRELKTAVETVPEQRSFRNAAYAIAVCLLILGLLGFASLYRSLARRPGSSASRASNQSNTATQQPLIVYTPQAALDYKEEKVEPEKAESESPVESSSAERKSSPGDGVAASIAQSKRSEAPEQRPVLASRQPAPEPAATPVSVSRPAPALELVLPRGTFGQVDARLVNVRSKKTQNGVRYDLTFNMQDQAGQTTQWERLAIATRSASGVSKTQTMPFYHRLGAAGTLTFTVSVEMQGRAQPDWQGRIICTSIGTDQAGKSHRASFGANVSPF